MRGKVRIAAAALSFAVLLGIVPGGMPVNGIGAAGTEAAQESEGAGEIPEDPALNRKSVKLRNGKTVKVKVRGTKKHISAVSSDKTIATVSRSGKNRLKIRAAGTKKGIAVIRVKTSAGFRYLCVRVGNGRYMNGKTRKWVKRGNLSAYVPRVSRASGDPDEKTAVMETETGKTGKRKAVSAKKTTGKKTNAKKTKKEKQLPEENGARSGAVEEYVVNVSTYKFHRPGCRTLGRLKSENRWDYRGTRSDLIEQGYDPCGVCHP